MSNLISYPNFSSIALWFGAAVTNEGSGGDPPGTSPNGSTTYLKVNTSGTTIYQNFTISFGAVPYYIRYYLKKENSGIYNFTISIINNATTSILASQQFKINASGVVTGPALSSTSWLTFTTDVPAVMAGDYRFQIQTNNESGSTHSIYMYLTDIYVGTSSNYCVNKGTKILSLRDGLELYIPIEQLNKETDLVKTYLNGFKKISDVKHMILNNNPDDFTSCMYIMEKKGNMVDDLVVSGGHSILEDSYESTEAEKIHKELFGGTLEKIDNKVLVLAGKSSKFRQIKNKEIFDIYHIALEGDENNEDKRYGIWANGVLTESTYKKILYKSLNLL
jgi:hypothetical protein